ncbi:MAG: AAA family ATPase [Planctomycetota bacterium]
MNTDSSPSPRRLRVVSVEKLFGVFDHRIELNEERITIIHGPNGFGKTAILRLVSGFFERHYSMLRNVPFESVSFELNDQTTICVRQSPPKQDERRAKPGLTILCGEHEWEWRQRPEIRHELPRHLIDERIPWLHRVEDDIWFDTQTGEQLDTAEVIDRYEEYLPIQLRPDRTPEWLQQIQDSVEVFFIRANRLESPTTPENVRKVRRRPLTSAPAVAAYAIELAERIQLVQSEYAKLSQSLDRTFPVRIMSPDQRSTLSLKDVKQRLAALDQQRRDLNNAGLLEQLSREGFEQLPEPKDSQLGVLTVYIDDVEQKLGVFRELRERIELFRELLNRRFLYKQVRVDKSQGLVFQTDSGQELPPTALSTGEQHEVVILYQLLFLTKPDSLVLIDEPEISLHVAWQKPFLQDLVRIAELSKVDFLIATHSPQIISNRWDLTVELKGPQR